MIASRGPRARPKPAFAAIRCGSAAALPILLLALLLLGCTPRVAPSGEADVTPRIETKQAEDADGSGQVLRMPDGTRLPLRSWRPDGAPKAAIVGLHGFNDYAEGYEMPGRWFAQHGYALYAYDQRGFGRAPHRGLWPSADTLIADAATAVDLVRARHPETPVYLMGLSMGGAVILAAAGADALPEVDGVVLAAPAVWARGEMPFYQRWALWLTVHTVPWLQLSGQGLDRLPSDNIPMLRALGRDPQVIGATRMDSVYGLTGLMSRALDARGALDTAVLALYGARDEIVPPEPTEKLWRALADRDTATLGLYDSGWHMLLRDLQAPAVWRDIAAWIDRGGRGPLPSGADAAAHRALSDGGLERRPRPERIRAGVTPVPKTGG